MHLEFWREIIPDLNPSIVTDNFPTKFHWMLLDSPFEFWRDLLQKYFQPYETRTLPGDYVELAFTNFATNDAVSVYSGTDSTGTLLASISGNLGTTTVDGNPPLFVTFVSTNSGQGFDAFYSSKYFCSGTTTLTDPTG